MFYVNLNISLLDNPELQYSRRSDDSEFMFDSYNPRLAAELKVRDRVRIVRNLYVRFISSYLDWQFRNKFSKAHTNATVANAIPLKMDLR